MIADLSLLHFDETTIASKGDNVDSYVKDVLFSNYKLWYDQLNDFLLIGTYCSDNFLATISQLEDTFRYNQKLIEVFFKTSPGLENFSTYMDIERYFTIGRSLDLLHQFVEKTSDKFAFQDQKIIFNLSLFLNQLKAITFSY